jgi:hypothetical protein
MPDLGKETLIDQNRPASMYARCSAGGWTRGASFFATLGLYLGIRFAGDRGRWVVTDRVTSWSFRLASSAASSSARRTMTTWVRGGRQELFAVTRARVRPGAVAVMSPGNSAPGTRSSVVTGIASGGDRSSTQSPKRRMVWVMYGEIVARSSVSIGCPSPARAFAAAVMSQA